MRTSVTSSKGSDGGSKNRRSTDIETVAGHVEGVVSLSEDSRRQRSSQSIIAKREAIRGGREGRTEGSGNRASQLIAAQIEIVETSSRPNGRNSSAKLILGQIQLSEGVASASDVAGNGTSELVVLKDKVGQSAASRSRLRRSRHGSSRQGRQVANGQALELRKRHQSSRNGTVETRQGTDRQVGQLGSRGSNGRSEVSDDSRKSVENEGTDVGVTNDGLRNSTDNVGQVGKFEGLKNSRDRRGEETIPGQVLQAQASKVGHGGPIRGGESVGNSGGNGSDGVGTNHGKAVEGGASEEASGRSGAIEANIVKSHIEGAARSIGDRIQQQAGGQGVGRTKVVVGEVERLKLGPCRDNIFGPSGLGCSARPGQRDISQLSERRP